MGTRGMRLEAGGVDRDDIVEELEKSPELAWYNQQAVTFEVLREFVEEFEKQASTLGIEPSVLAKLRRNLILLTQDVERGARDYFTILVDYERAARVQQFKLEGEKLREAEENHDRHRRILHNALLSSLNALTRFINVNLKKVGIVIDLSGRWFTLEQLQNRDYIGDWAYGVGKAKIVQERLEKAEM